MDHCADKTQLAHASFKLVRRRRRILHRQMSKSGVSIRMAQNLTGEEIVNGSRLRDGGGGARLHLDTGDRQRQNRAPNPGFIHRAQAQFIEVQELRSHGFASVVRHMLHGLEPILFTAGCEEVLFKRYLIHLDHST